MDDSDDDLSSSSTSEKNEQSRENGDKPSLIAEPSELDVLLGRGKSNKNWPGKELELLLKRLSRRDLLILCLFHAKRKSEISR